MKTILEFVWDFFDRIHMWFALRDYRKGNFEDAEDVFKRLGL